VFCRGAACLRPCPDLRDLNVFEANTVPAFPAPERRSPVQWAQRASSLGRPSWGEIVKRVARGFDNWMFVARRGFN